MTSYAGRHAELYDTFYADKPYELEAAFVHECLQKHSIRPSQKVLELACGTGTHALALEQHGYSVLATDYSEAMLARARAKAAAVSSSVVFQLHDMRKLDLTQGPFDAVVCLFDSIGYAETNEALADVLHAIHHQLRPDGLFIFEFWHAPPMLRSYEPLRVRRWPTEEGEILRISQTELEIARSLARVTYSVYELRKEGTYSMFVESQTNRYFLVPEMAGMLSRSGLEPVKWFDGFSSSERITGATWHVVAVARNMP
jgi:SAM-dependent methyltransferase